MKKQTQKWLNFPGKCSKYILNKFHITSSNRIDHSKKSKKRKIFEKSFVVIWVVLCVQNINNWFGAFLWHNYCRTCRNRDTLKRVVSVKKVSAAVSFPPKSLIESIQFMPLKDRSNVTQKKSQTNFCLFSKNSR